MVVCHCSCSIAQSSSTPAQLDQCVFETIRVMLASSIGYDCDGQNSISNHVTSKLCGHLLQDQFLKITAYFLCAQLGKTALLPTSAYITPVYSFFIKLSLKQKTVFILHKNICSIKLVIGKHFKTEMLHSRRFRTILWKCKELMG